MSEDQSSTPKGAVLLSFFKSGRKKYKVFYNHGELVWEPTKPPSRKLCFILVFCVFTFRFAEPVKVFVDDVIAVHTITGSSNANNEPEQAALGFRIHYAVRGQGKTWKYCRITFRHPDSANSISWVKVIQTDLLSM